MRRLSLTILTCLTLAAWLLACGSTSEKAPPTETAPLEVTETVDFSFVFFGCNRVGWSPSQPSPSTANVAQLEQTLLDISQLQKTAGLPAPPRYLFLLGDIVRNEEEDQGQTLTQQLSAWQELWERQPFSTSATEPVLLPGNHEVLASIESPPDSGTYYEIPNPPTYDIWTDWLVKSGFDKTAGNGPNPEIDPQDQLAGDNSRLTWSFSTDLQNGKSAHFVVINTDTLSTARTEEEACLQNAQYASSPLPGWIPIQWIDADIAQAEGNSETELIFAFGHKPILAPGGSDTVGRSNILNCSEYPQADQLTDTFQKNSKFVAYLAAHTHEWNSAELGDGEGRQVPQIIAGNGGSPLSGGDLFGFTLVTVYTNGKVTATSYGRPAPDPYDSPNAGGPATAQETVVLREAAG